MSKQTKQKRIEEAALPLEKFAQEEGYSLLIFGGKKFKEESHIYSYVHGYTDILAGVISDRLTENEELAEFLAAVVLSNPTARQYIFRAIVRKQLSDLLQSFGEEE